MNAPLPPPPSGSPDASGIGDAGPVPTPTLPTLPALAAPTPIVPGGVPTLPAAAPRSHPDGLAPPTVPLTPPAPSHPTVFATPDGSDGARLDADRPDRRRRGAAPRWLASLLVVMAGAGAWFVLGGGVGDRGDVADPPTMPAPTDSGTTDSAASSGNGQQSNGPDSIGQIAADAISDTEQLVDVIDDRDRETELLAELGLDASGGPLPEPPAGSAPPAGHTFRWTDRDGSVATITVATDTGDHALRTDGIEFRSIGGQAFARTIDDPDWAELAASDIAAIDRLGLDAPLTIRELLGGAASFAVDEAGTSTIDDASFAASDPASRSAWLDLIGLGDTVDGPLVASYELLADGDAISSAAIERPATGERVSYELVQLHEQPPVIDLLD